MALEVMAKATTPIPLDVAFRVEPGELLALVGHSGSGKSTLLRTIAGLWRPAEARVRVNGETWLDTSSGIDLAPHRRRAGIVFQSYALFPHMSALANVTAAMGHLPTSQREQRARELLRLVNLQGLETRKPATLSGGQQQRVAVARALAREPTALLLDEPFSAVDRATRERLYAEIRALRAHLAMPTVLVTHDLEEARLLADRMVVIEAGGIVGSGSTAQIMSDPAALSALGMREIGSSLPARVEAQEEDGLTRLATAAGPIWLPHVEGAPGTPVALRIMAQDVIVARDLPSGLSALNRLPATVAARPEGQGPSVLLRLDVGGSEILASLTARSVRTLALEPGMPCHVIVKSVAVARGDVSPSSPQR
ncbi:MAG: molybdenum ABC transporter ATP-binding protein [Rhizobiaceae bacterium]